MSKPLHLANPNMGLGCMNLSHAYGSPIAEERAIKTLHAAFEIGYRHFDTATLYGAGDNELLIGKALKDRRDEFFLASKCGMAMVDGKKEINGQPKNIRKQCEDSLKRLQTDHIDLYYLHRLDFNVAIEESAGTLGELVKEGKIGAVGLSEVSAETLTRAHNEFPISAIQSEYSLWTRNPEIAVLETCKQLDITFVAFSPLGRGFLTGTLKDIADLKAKDIRNNMPRFSTKCFPNNLALLNDFFTLAKNIGCTPAQLALAWLTSKNENIIPIPGTRSVDHMKDNFESVQLTLDTKQMSLLDEMINQENVHGTRYTAAQQAEIDTEEF